MQAADEVGARHLAEAYVVFDLLQERAEGTLDFPVPGLEEELVAVRDDPDAEKLLEHPQVAVVGSADLGQDRLVAQDHGQRLLHSPP